MGESFFTLQVLICGLLLELSLVLAGQGLEVVILAPKEGHWFYLGESGGHQPQNFIDRTNDWSTPSRILGVAG